MITTLPHEFKLRHYQRDLMRAMFVDDKKHVMAIWHRRAGKTETCCNIITAKAMERVGAYYYFLPTLTQGRKIIWEGIGANGTKFIDHFPASLITRVNNTEMMIKFKNGSIFRLLGTDNQNYNKTIGTNPVGVVYDEFALQDPNVRDYMIPIMAENDGWEIIISTPRGHNHLFQLWNKVKDHPEWYNNVLTVSETFKEEGIHVVDKGVIQDYVDKYGWSDNKVQQEFYCDWDAAIQGSIFGKYISLAEKNNRIYNFEIDQSVPVNTYWDLGYSDATAIWFVQKCQGHNKVIGYYQNNNQSINHYINELSTFRDQHGIVYDKHFAPHDSSKHDLGTGLTLIQQAAKLGLSFIRLPQPKSKELLIEVAWSQFNQFHFHKTNTEPGMNALREYQRSFNQVMGTHGPPMHNWASHAADAFMYICQELRQSKHSTGGFTIRNVVNSERIF